MNTKKATSSVAFREVGWETGTSSNLFS